MINKLIMIKKTIMTIINYKGHLVGKQLILIMLLKMINSKTSNFFNQK